LKEKSFAVEFLFGKIPPFFPENFVTTYFKISKAIFFGFNK